MSRPILITAFLSSSALLLSACGNSAELERKLASVEQCINAPATIQKSFALADQDGRIPVYVTIDNTDQYDSTDWYQANKAIYNDMEWDLEDWSTISDLSECDQALSTIEAENPKNTSVSKLRSFLKFNETIFEKYSNEQLEDASFELEFILLTAQSCLFEDAYPEAFISVNYDETRELYPAAFLVQWDGDNIDAFTSTADGRDPLWRPIKPVRETGCLDELNSLPESYINRATSTDDDFLLTWSEYYAYTKRFSDFAIVVDDYNQIADGQHKELEDLGTEIPPLGPYTPPVIYTAGIDHFSDWDFKQLVKNCQSTKPKTFVNGRGETLKSPSQECGQVQTLCNSEEIKPPLDQNICAPYIYK